MKSVLFVCLGNICRSPIGHAVFEDMIKRKNLTSEWSCDSAAIIDYHVGKRSDKRALQTLKAKGIDNYNHIVRQIRPEDFAQFDWIFGMDEDNIGDLKEIGRKCKSNAKAKVELLGKYDPAGDPIIKDPYYGNDIRDFEVVFEQCVRSCEAFLEKHK